MAWAAGVREREVASAISAMQFFTDDPMQVGFQVICWTIIRKLLVRDLPHLLLLTPRRTMRAVSCPILGAIDSLLEARWYAADLS